MKHVLMAAALACGTVACAQSYGGISLASMQYKDAALKHAGLKLENQSNHVLEVNFLFSQYFEGENMDLILTVQPGYGEYATVYKQDNMFEPIEEHVVEMPVVLHYYFLTSPHDPVAFTISAGAYPSYVVSSLTDDANNPDFEDFRLGLISDYSLQFNLSGDERLKAATGLRFKIDWTAYKDHPGSTPAYNGAGFFLSILGRL